MRAVLDTNVWLSAVFWDGEASRIVELAEEKRIEIVISRDILSEIVDVLNSEAKFQRFLEDRKQNTEDLLRTILWISGLVTTKSKVSVIKEHPKDNIVLEAAKDGGADYIISYDRHILNLGEFGKTRIVSPGQFLRQIKFLPRAKHLLQKTKSNSIGKKRNSVFHGDAN